MKSDIEIAQSTALLPIAEIASAAGIDAADLSPYGRTKAKVDHRLVRRLVAGAAADPSPEPVREPSGATAMSAGQGRQPGTELTQPRVEGRKQRRRGGRPES